MMRAAAFFAGVGCLGLLGIALVALRFVNPDMTDTRLFLTYWPLFALMLGSGGLVVWGMAKWR